MDSDELYVGIICCLSSATPVRRRSGGGTLYVFEAVTEAAREWISENVSRSGFQPAFPGVIYCEHRYVGSLVESMRTDRLRVI